MKEGCQFNFGVIINISVQFTRSSKVFYWNCKLKGPLLKHILMYKLKCIRFIKYLNMCFWSHAIEYTKRFWVRKLMSNLTPLNGRRGSYCLFDRSDLIEGECWCHGVWYVNISFGIKFWFEQHHFGILKSWFSSLDIFIISFIQPLSHPAKNEISKENTDLNE